MHSLCEHHKGESGVLTTVKVTFLNLFFACLSCETINAIMDLLLMAQIGGLIFMTFIASLGVSQRSIKHFGSTCYAKCIFSNCALLVSRAKEVAKESQW
jgi:hypothetical protein